MNRFKEIIKNEAGASMLTVIVIVAVALTSIGYVITDVLPKLNTSVNKSKSVLNYKVFVSSINDYIVHGVRERWCLDSADNDEVYTFEDMTTQPAIITNLLVSNDCSSQKSMEEIVTYKANLERILWSRETAIGSTDYTVADPPSNSQANNILALNYINRLGDPSLPKLIAEDIELKNARMILRVKGSTLTDITSSHPLFPIVQPVSSCIDKVDILIEKEQNLNDIPAGDERKFSITIEVDLKEDLQKNCEGAKIVNSKSFYSLIPRRNHSFALIKYGDLSANIFADYHGPVYVAGDLVLPPANADKSKTSLFLNNLTLGIYDDGVVNSGQRKAGKLVNYNGTPYTFNDRGHPFKGKHSSYDEFRGLLGGLRLDGQEDKGLVNLFDYAASSNVDISTLENCVDEQTYLTTPSSNSNSTYLYDGLQISAGQSFKLKYAFTERNRFKEQLEAPVVLSGGDSGGNNNNGSNGNNGNNGNNSNNGHHYILQDPSFSPNTIKANSLLKILPVKDFKEYKASIGIDTTLSLSLKLDLFGADAGQAEDILTKLNAINKSNWSDVFDVTNIFQNLPEASSFNTARDAFIGDCEGSEQLSVCETYGYDAANTCDPCTLTYDDSSFVSAVSSAVTKVTTIKNLIEQSGEANLSFMIEKLSEAGGKTLLNQQNLSINANTKLQSLLTYIDFPEIELEYSPYHYGTAAYKMRMKIEQDSLTKSNLIFSFGKYDDVNDVWTYEPLNSGGWYTVDTNTLVQSPNVEEVVELECPEGIGVASWGLDMSSSTNFAWNYANTPPGVVVESPDHTPADDIEFSPDNVTGRDDGNINMSIVKECTVKATMEHVYGFYVCEKLIIESGRSKDLHLIGTFIVKTIDVQEQNYKLHWHSVWDEYATDMIISDLKQGSCDGIMGKTWKDFIADDGLYSKAISCSPQDLIEQGPNNMTWTTVDPDIGIAKPGDAMTSQKVKRFKNYVINEISRVDNIK